MTRIYKEAGRPLPRFHEDDVLDYIIMETMVARAATDDAKLAKTKERETFRKGHRDFRKAAGGSRGRLR